MDAKPSLEIDVRDHELEQILRCFVERRTSAEMSAAAESIGYRDSATEDRVKLESRCMADQIIGQIEHDADYSDYSSKDQKRFLLRMHIQEELLRQFDKGIVSLAAQASCPLMWSHYGDEHRGMCIGYSVPNNASCGLHKVKYGVSRLVQASKVAAMVDGNDLAQKEVFEAVLLQKSENWKYEQEWRLIGRSGLHNSPLELEEIIFGMSCGEMTKYVTMTVLRGRTRPVKFYELREVPGTFNLAKHTLTYNHERFHRFPRRYLSTSDLFRPAGTSS